MHMFEFSPIIVKDGEIASLTQRMRDAIDEIDECYHKLQDLGYIEVRPSVEYPPDYFGYSAKIKTSNKAADQQTAETSESLTQT